ncbi:RNA dependent RNA polymerase-domain-containing protein [Desarmillaria tabescens]|uniref:RNA-dependent RNA polymerase n=1 Tax=Armillaria tabescens TaxID=1929756 RepID=A0AA39TT86_ARMTA|nr:RNA dependent RNA polymerase-domain-containing protein [Desarmillaria tabescens]KAK0462914.1 RNA dependent RNA polymerase-domain-containing protein [Desarmillaria tabescens]
MADEFLNSIQFGGYHAEFQNHNTGGAGEKPRDEIRALAFRIPIYTFGMGFIRGPPTQFVPGYQAEDLERAQLSLNFGKQEMFFKAKFDADDIPGKSQGYSAPANSVTSKRPPQIKADWKFLYPRDEPLPPGVHIRRATEDDWNLHIPKDEHCCQALSPLPSGDRQHALMKFGHWRTFRFTTVLDKRARDSVLHTLDRLRTLERGEEARTTVDFDPIAVSRTSPSTINSIAEYLRREYEEHPNPFECQYLFLGLISHGILLPHVDSVAGLKHFVHFSVSAANPKWSKQVKSAEAVHITQAGHFNDAGFPTDLPSDRIFMRRATIETSNRVIRRWKEFQDNFLRVSFGDEDGKLRVNGLLQRSDDDNPRTGVLARIRIALEEGIQIGPRRYVFLAAGESQLKEHSCWMIYEEPDRGFTADIVRQHMGDFGHIRVVAKYASRMGLCFSATRKVCDITSVEEVEDIQHGGYNYTDGVGNCSAELADQCAKALGNTASPSAVQIRMGGYKGVLSVLPHLQPNHICMRPSMRKFASDSIELGVMKISTHSHAHLNRQAISLLSHLGVPDEVFARMMKAQIDNIRNIERHIHRLDDSKHEARKLYKSSELPILQMLKAGFAREHLLRNVLKCIECQLLQDLKYRARIQVNDGAFLMGIADGHRVLKPGEIYCAVHPPGGKRRVVTGQCTIFRNPCLHPGDIQLATAVDHEIFSSELWQGRPPTNVVVFSTQPGERNLPNKLSGGDLDGDFFTVLWDPELQIEDPEEPMDYTPVDPIEIPEEQESVDVEDICEFFVDADHLRPEFMKSDVLGLVSHIHEAKSDELDPSHPHCVPVKIPLHLQNSIAPDFQREDGYISPKVLGQLFRLIEPPPEYSPISGSQHTDIRLRIQNVSALYLQNAGKAKHAYDIELEGLMRRHSMCEAELWAGVSINGDRKKRRERDSAVRGPVKEVMEALRRTYRNHCAATCQGSATAMRSKDMKKWAIAAYQVTHESERTAQYVNVHNESRRGSTPGSMYADEGLVEEPEEVPRRLLISFPWIWALELCHAVTDDIIKEEEEEEDDAALLRGQVEDV